MVLTNEFRLGTITRKDTGTHIIDNFGMGYEKRKKLDLQVLDQKVSFRKAVTEMWTSVSMTVGQAHQELEKLEIDSHFIEFYQWAVCLGYPVTILSSGLLELITVYLSLHFPQGLDKSTKILANNLVIDPSSSQWDIKYLDDTDHGHDKGQALRNAKANHPDATIVFIGDGISDLSAAKEAHYVFAKRGKDLAIFCSRQGITHYEWEDFSEIMLILKSEIIK